MPQLNTRYAGVFVGICVAALSGEQSFTVGMGRRPGSPRHTKNAIERTV